jgi:predicted branched-subunit amino acid permease
MSLLIFTGASQFRTGRHHRAGGSLLSGSRRPGCSARATAFYGLRLASVLHVRGWRRLVGAHLVIDESTRQAVAHDEPELARAGFWYGGGILFVCWNLATFVGALAGARLGDPKAYGLDAASSAAFVALLWPRLSTPHHPGRRYDRRRTRCRGGTPGADRSAGVGRRAGRRRGRGAALGRR